MDGTATLLALTPINPDATETTDWRLGLQLPEALTRHVAPQGSITIEGISLTVASIVGTEVEIAIIPHTYASTSLRRLVPGEPLTSRWIFCRSTLNARTQRSLRKPGLRSPISSLTDTEWSLH